MISGFQFLVAPLMASLLLLVITSYFGIHVLKREIIFIDIALAQVAALGGIVTIFFDQAFNIHGISFLNIPLHDILPYLLSLIYCLIAALIFTFLKNPKITVPIEAFIGIAYAFATTAAVIILDKSAGGDVHIHDLLTGTILWTSWPQVLRLGIIVLIIGSFHYIFKNRFIQLTDTYAGRNHSIRYYKLWDFLFYFTFGIVIIEAIRIGGILTVFAFLILPASFSALFSARWDHRIFFGLCSGIIATVIGLSLSWTFDITSSPLIILFLGLLLTLGIIFKRLLKLQKA